MLQFLLYPIPALLYFLFLAYINHTPLPQTISLENGTDKIAHFFAYSLLSFLVIRTIFKYNLFGFYFWSFVFCLSYAAVDELWQKIVPGRCASLYDFAFNFLGVLAIYLFYWRKNRNANYSS